MSASSSTIRTLIAPRAPWARAGRAAARAEKSCPRRARLHLDAAAVRLDDLAADVEARARAPATWPAGAGRRSSDRRACGEQLGGTAPMLCTSTTTRVGRVPSTRTLHAVLRPRRAGARSRPGSRTPAAGGRSPTRRRCRPRARAAGEARDGRRRARPSPGAAPARDRCAPGASGMPAPMRTRVKSSSWSIIRAMRAPLVMMRSSGRVSSLSSRISTRFAAIMIAPSGLRRSWPRMPVNISLKRTAALELGHRARSGAARRRRGWRSRAPARARRAELARRVVVDHELADQPGRRRRAG